MKNFNNDNVTRYVEAKIKLSAVSKVGFIFHLRIKVRHKLIKL